LGAFVGRERDLREVGEGLASARLATLTGIGGIGKTRLAIRVAEECAWEYADGTWFVDLAPLSDAALVPQAVARVLQVHETPGVPLTETLQEALGTRQLLLVLDNCEHLIDACARLADALLSACPHLRILATSRQPLGLTGETVWPVSPLSLPESAAPETGRWSSQALLKFAAIQLFVERAAAACPGFALRDNNAAAIVQVCRRLEGIPLAIELAVARSRALPIEQIAARLDDRFRLLTGGSRAALPRQQTLRATMDWSYDLLSERERMLMRRLSVFAGGWTLEAAQAVCDGAFVPEWELLELLISLVEKSLVVYEEKEAGPRYWLLETVRQYFGERLLEAGEGDTTRGRHLEYFLTLAEEAERQLISARQGEWLDRLETELDNLRAALAFSSSVASCQLPVVSGGASERASLTTGNWQLATEMGLRLAGALWRFWSVRGYLTEGRERLAQALASAPEPTAGRAKALGTAGSLAYRQADYQNARSLQEESLAIRRELGDRPGMATSLRNLGLIAHSQGDYDAARSLHQESLAIGRELGSRWVIAASLNDLGSIANWQEDYAVARLLYEESLAIRRALGDRLGVADSLRNLGSVTSEQGDHAAARSLYEESLAIRRELGDRPGIAASLRDLGSVAYLQGELGIARSLHEESLAIRHELGVHSGIAESLEQLGLVVYAQGDHGSARSFYEESLAIRRALGDRSGIVGSLRNLGLIAYQQGDHLAARSLRQEILAIGRELGDQGLIAGSLHDLGLIAYSQRDYQNARSLQEESLAIRRALGDRRGMAASLEALAALACTGQGQRGADGVAGEGRLLEGETTDAAGAAARLLGAAQALREALGVSVPLSEQEAHHRAVSRAREILGEEAFAAAWVEGREMTLDQAISYGLQGPGPV
jgi:non-specific serine/threonine protein kinase